MNRFRLYAVTALPLALALALAGCTDTAMSTAVDTAPGGATSSSAAAPSVDVQGNFNSADSMFAMMMVPHHQQAVEMSDMILSKDEIDEQVVALAQQIRDAQAPEIELMQSWLDAWGMSDADGMDGMNMGGGMMSGDDMTALDDADGTAATELFLEQMIVHHEGAIEMALAELSNGNNADALALAQDIVDTQTAEIDLMQDLLAQI